VACPAVGDQQIDEPAKGVDDEARRDVGRPFHAADDDALDATKQVADLAADSQDVTDRQAAAGGSRGRGRREHQRQRSGDQPDPPATIFHRRGAPLTRQRPSTFASARTWLPLPSLATVVA
jgi:hypothetical protein